MTPGVTAVIVNYNAGAELRQALQSIAGDSGPEGWDAVIVDNASSDGSADFQVTGQDGQLVVVAAGPPDDVGEGGSWLEGVTQTAFEHIPGRLARAARIAFGLE